MNLPNPPYSYELYKKKLFGCNIYSILFMSKVVGMIKLEKDLVEDLVVMLNGSFTLAKEMASNAPNKRLTKAIEVLQRLKNRYPYIWGESVTKEEVDIINGK